MTEKDFQVTIKVRNARLLRRIRDCGYKSVADFSRTNGLYNGFVGEVVLFKVSPVRVDGEWKDWAFSISSALHCEPEDIWPEHIARLKSNRGRVELDCNMDELQALNAPRDEAVDRVSLSKMLATLPDRQRRIVEQRYGLDGPEMTYDEIAQYDGVTRERIRQVEAKALRKLKHPSRREGLRS